jgi:hypothetical protein
LILGLLWLNATWVAAQDTPATGETLEVPSPEPGPSTTDTGGIPMSPAPAEEQPMPAKPAAPVAHDTTDDFHLSVGGGMILYYYQPLTSPPGTTKKNFFEVFEAKIRLDAEFKQFGLHIVPILRDTKERGFFPGTAWVQEAYAFAKLGAVTIKAGKVWGQFGRFWDNSFYGNAQEFDGLKLDPNHGVSIEGLLGAEQRMGLQFYAQYFIIDGTTNYSLPGRDTMSIPDAHRRNQLIGRVEPFMKLGEITTLKLGLSGAYFQADLPEPTGKQNVSRFALDATLIVGGFTGWAEFTKQFGRQVTDFPFPAVTDAAGNVVTPGRSADRIDYMMFGGEYTFDRLTFRFNFNQGNYRTVDYRETRYVPGIALSLDEHLFVLLEWALAHTHTGSNTTLLDNSLNLTIHGKV